MRKLIYFFAILSCIYGSRSMADQEVIKNGKINIIRETVNEDGETVFFTEYRGDGREDDPNIHNPPPRKEDVLIVKNKIIERPEFTEEEPLPDPNLPPEKQPDFLQRKKEFEERRKAFLDSVNGQN